MGEGSDFDLVALVKSFALKPKEVIEKQQLKDITYRNELNKDPIYKEYRRQYRTKSRGNYVELIKNEMLLAYGNKCVQCSIADPDVLVLDHIDNNGHQDRMYRFGNRNTGGVNLYVRLKKEGWPKIGYQLLCCNCNHKKELERRRNNRSYSKDGDK